VVVTEGERGREIDCELTSLAPAPTPFVDDGRRSTPAPFLLPVPAPKTPQSTTLPWEVWPLAGLSAAGFVGFAALGLSGTSEQNELKLTCAPKCTQSEVDPVRTKFTLADVSLVIGALALGATVLVLILHSSSSAPRAISRSASAADR
jgi:hypothetical protein